MLVIVLDVAFSSIIAALVVLAIIDPQDSKQSVIAGLGFTGLISAFASDPSRKSAATQEEHDYGS